MVFKELVKSVVPKPALQTYHWTLANLAAFWYGYPSEKLVVIGVTGTKGKSTTASLIAQLFELTGHRVGLTSTAVMKIGEREWLNERKMTMPGRFRLQKMLYDMVQAGCQVAVVETSSEGLAQYRHIGVHYDVAVFTNLSPEHIDSHGSYEAYRAAKGILFRYLKKLPTKTLDGQRVAKTVVLNRDDAEHSYFEQIAAGDTWRFGLNDGHETAHELIGKITSFTSAGVAVACRGHELAIPLIGKINAYNLLAAATVLLSRGVPFERISEVVARVKPVPGRQEFITVGQPFTVVVDYAHEPLGFSELYALLAVVPHQRLIHVFGATGGGRDAWRRPVMGEMAAHHADVVILTTDDPYDDDPAELAKQVAVGTTNVRAEGKMVEVQTIIDRRQAIHAALAMAQPNDLVLITGKGAEQTMALARGNYIPWDDRAVVRDELPKTYAS